MKTLFKALLLTSEQLNYLTFTAVEANSAVLIKKNGLANIEKLQYKYKDDSGWNQMYQNTPITLTNIR